MFYAYVIQSKKDGSFYKVHCQNMEERLKQHNNSLTVSIKNKVPFEIKYFEKFDTRLEAIKREKNFKSAAGRKFLKSIISS